MSAFESSFLSANEGAKVKAVYETLAEKDQRRYLASLSLALPHGGCKYLADLVGCSKGVITRGRKELDTIKDDGDPAEGRQRREGAGRPKKVDEHPELRDELEEILDERTAGDPTDQTTCWTYLPITEIADLLTNAVTFVSWPVVKQLCQERDLKKRQQVNSVTKAPSRDRDEQFGIINRLRSLFRRTKDAIFSIDSKQKEMLGNVQRPGDVLADGPVETLDHPLPSYATGEIITHGIYDPQHNTAHMNLSSGHDTGAFACASFQWYWERIGQLAHAAADRILLLMDCGGSNNYRSNVFKHNLSLVSAAIGLPIQVAHLPVYCSKYNPIERRVFPHVERAYSGQIFTSADQMVDAIESRACTSTGLVTTAHVLEETFRPANKAQQKLAANVVVEYPEKLNDYNYKVIPQNQH